jgi:hypothetical protein
MLSPLPVFSNCDFVSLNSFKPVPVVARSKAWVYGRSPAEILGSNPTRGQGRLSVVSVVCCQVEVCATG